VVTTKRSEPKDVSSNAMSEGSGVANNRLDKLLQNRKHEGIFRNIWRITL